MAEVLVAGSAGGREIALAQALAASEEVTRVEVAADIREGLDRFTGGEKPFVVIGPEAPLVAGAADELRDDGYVVFGANKQAAQYEASKSFATKMARRYGIVHPDTTIIEGINKKMQARNYIVTHNARRYVIKADGLAGGKGVVLPNSTSEALEIVNGMLDGSLYGAAGKEAICFQEREEGPEVSAMVVVGGKETDFVVLPLAQDHKRLMDGDEGPNTGGMGAYAPVPEHIVSQQQLEKIHDKAYASLRGMRKNGTPFTRGVLYMGLMMSENLRREGSDDSTLIEYNVRFGDPETQVIWPLATAEGIDAYRLLHGAAKGDLDPSAFESVSTDLGHAALTVCLAAEGYPDSPRKGDRIHGLDASYPDVTIQAAGTSEKDGATVTNGGRVLYVTAVGETIDQAAASAYAAIGHDAVHFNGMQYRTDIGWQARTRR